MKRNQPLPDVIQNAPSLRPDLFWLMEVFWDLGRDRPLGFGAVGMIPWSTMDRWARRYGVEGEEFEYLTQVIGAIDAAFLEHMANKHGKPGAIRGEDADPGNSPAREGR